MASKRIHDIAKELGITSKVIIEKCIAEGVPADMVKNHMAVVKAGLEASIREWFAESTDGSTAVENAEHVDVKALRKKAARRPAKKAITKADEGEGDHDEGGETATATLTEEPPAAATSPARRPAPATAKPSIPRVAPSTPMTPAELPHVDPSEVVDPTTETAKAVPHTPAAAETAAAKAPRPVPTARVVAPGQPGAGESEPSVNGRAGEQSRGGGAATAEPEQEGGDGEGSTAATAEPVTPAPMNVPTRPKVVAPAGPQLQVKTPVRLSGPKVVRIEAPEVVQAPRPRRETGDAGPGGRGAGRGGGGGEGDDSPRSPRRNTKGGGNKRGDTARGGVPARRRGWAGPDDAPPGGAWSEQDLIEREARLSRAGGFLRSKRQALKKAGPGGTRAATAAETGGVVKIAAPFTIKDLSAATGVKAADIIKKLFMQGVMATVNSGIDSEKAQEVMIDFNIELEVEQAKTAEQLVSEVHETRTMVDERPRGPIVTILGHVDHGKTSLLDKIRNANVAAGEAGGITQATSAFRVPVTIGGETKHVVFLDTPGHEAFTAMRARGAAITDIVVLVVSAPEGVMPQTVESINHAKAAGVPIVVALNKIDRPDATEARVNQTLSQLAENGLNPVEWGGDTEIVRTSATQGTGVEHLLEVLDLQGQLLELKADFGGAARGTVVEAKPEEGRGATANVIVQDGELKVGDFIVVGRAFGKVRDIVDDRGNRLRTAGPGDPVRISGFDELPSAGDKFYIVDSLDKARDAAEQRRFREREAALAQPKVTLDSLLSQMGDRDVKEILIVLKADVQGSVDVLKNEIERLSTKEVKARVLHAAVGGITESDVLLADASRAVIIGFNVIPSAKARTLSDAKNVEIRTYQVIYEITDDVRKAAEGLLEPERKQQIIGHAEVRKVFKVSKVGAIAGCYVTDGTIERSAFIRVTRNDVVIENDRVLEQLKRVKDDVKDVRAGVECGMKIAGYDDIKEGDILECYKITEVKRTL